MNLYEREKLADAVEERWCKQDDVVIREGDFGDRFFLVISGTAVATKTVEPGKAPVQIEKYAEGDYFGERALIRNEPRFANIIATSQLQLASFDRQSFGRLFGPVEQVLANMTYTTIC